MSQIALVLKVENRCRACKAIAKGYHAECLDAASLAVGEECLWVRSFDFGISGDVVLIWGDGCLVFIVSLEGGGVEG